MTTYRNETDYLKVQLGNLSHSLKYFEAQRNTLESTEPQDLEHRLDTILRHYDLVLTLIRGEIVETKEKIRESREDA